MAAGLGKAPRALEHGSHQEVRRDGPSDGPDTREMVKREEVHRWARNTADPDLAATYKLAEARELLVAHAHLRGRQRVRLELHLVVVACIVHGVCAPALLRSADAKISFLSLTSPDREPRRTN